MRFVRIEGVRSVHGDIEKTHPIEIDLQNRHVRPQSGRHPGGVYSGRSTANHQDVAWENTGHSTEENPGPAAVFSKEIAAHYSGHAPRDLAHRLQQRQAA